MRLLKIAFVGVLVAGVNVYAADDKPAGGKTNAEKIVGVWVMELPPGAPPSFEAPVFEFTKDGKVKMKFKNPQDGKEMVKEATYEVKGDSITLVPPKGEKERDGSDAKPTTSKLKTVTDKELVILNEKGGQKHEMKFKKK